MARPRPGALLTLGVVALLLSVLLRSLPLAIAGMAFLLVGWTQGGASGGRPGAGTPGVPVRCY